MGNQARPDVPSDLLSDIKIQADEETENAIKQASSDNDV